MHPIFQILQNLQSLKNSFSRAQISLATIVLACLVVAIPVSCAHPGQITLQIGQCVLDDGVLGQVFTALGQPDYTQEIANLALRDIPDLVDCALQAIASQSTHAGSGSGSGPSASPALAQEALPLQVVRAREILASRARASGGGH